MQWKNDRVNDIRFSPWAVARNYESMLDIYMKNYPDIDY